LYSNLFFKSYLFKNERFYNLIFRLINLKQEIVFISSSSFLDTLLFLIHYMYFILFLFYFILFFILFNFLFYFVLFLFYFILFHFFRFYINFILFYLYSHVWFRDYRSGTLAVGSICHDDINYFSARTLLLFVFVIARYSLRPRWLHGNHAISIIIMRETNRIFARINDIAQFDSLRAKDYNTVRERLQFPT